jgi:hypothetical protein
MLGHVRAIASLARRGNAFAVALCVLLGAGALAMAAPGGRAYMRDPCPPLHRPATEPAESAKIAIAASAGKPPPAPLRISHKPAPGPPLSRPRALERGFVPICPLPASPCHVRGPPRPWIAVHWIRSENNQRVGVPWSLVMTTISGSS